MRTTISVGFLILADWLECSAQVRTARLQNVQSPVRVARGKSEMDGGAVQIYEVKSCGSLEWYGATFPEILEPSAEFGAA
jgi:hypothetical protein